MRRPWVLLARPPTTCSGSLQHAHTGSSLQQTGNACRIGFNFLYRFPLRVLVTSGAAPPAAPGGTRSSPTSPSPRLVQDPDRVLAEPHQFTTTACTSPATSPPFHPGPQRTV